MADDARDSRGFASKLPTSPLGVGPPSLASLAAIARLDNAIEPTIFGAPKKYTLNELAELAGATQEQVHNLAKWIGRPPKEPGERRYTDSDVEVVRQAGAFAEDVDLDDAAMGAFVRGMAWSMERLATRQVEAMVQRVADQEQVGDTMARLIVAERAPKHAATLLPLVAHTYQRHFANAVRRLTTEAIAQRGLLSDDVDYPLVRAIGFADLVNFTARTKKATPREFAELIQNFSDTCWDIVNDNNGRIINFIGDAVLFVADTVEDGAEIALNIATPGALGVCGPVRVGLVWSRVISTYGDEYGPGVNLASRLAAAATPSEVLAGPNAARLLRRMPEFDVAAQKIVDAQGIGPVQVARLRYANDPAV